MGDEMEQVFRPYVNLPPITKTRSTSHLSPAQEHHRSKSYEDSTATASSSEDSGVRFRDNGYATQESPTPSTMYVAAYEYVGKKDDELDLPLGSMIKLITTETHEDGWYKGELDGKIGLFPSNYVRLIGDEENLNEFSAEDIRLPDQKKTLDDYNIGRGATATVFKVDIKVYQRNSQGQRISKFNIEKAALKRFHTYIDNHSRKNETLDSSKYEMLKREANLVNGLHHPNIVHLLGICLEKPYFGLLLELCEGSSLRAVYRGISADKSIPFRVLIDWAQQIASGMEYLSQQGYVHRDLKADNVLVKEEVCFCLDEGSEIYQWCPKCGRRQLERLQLKITDFGVTRKISADMNRTSAVGTYAWLAPEAFSEGKYSQASDVWSFGVVLWEMLSREEPYQGQIPITVAYQTARNGQTLAIDENCPEKWKNMMNKCWYLTPSSRPTFHELVEYLKEYASEIQDTSISGALDTQLQRVQSIIAQGMNNIYTRCSSDQKNELEKFLNKLYAPIGGTERKRRELVAPETKARNKGHRGKKPDISAPVGEMKHLVSIQRDDKSDTNLKCFYADEKTPGGTLPRSNGKLSTLSASTPDLNQAIDSLLITNGHGTISKISRQKAIRIKNRSHLPHAGIETPISTPTSHFYDHDQNGFAKIETANDIDHSPESKKTGKKINIFSRFKKNKRESKEDEDRAGTISSRTSSTTSSKQIPPMFSGQHTRGAAAPSFFDSSARTRAASAVDYGEDQYRKYTKENYDVARPSHLPSHPHHRKSALDQSIPISPSSPDQSNYGPMPIGSSRRTTTSSVDGTPNYEMLSQPQLMATPPASLSTYIPVGANEPTHYHMQNGMIMGGVGHGAGTSYYPVGGGCDDYIPVPTAIPPIPTEINNLPFPDPSGMITGRNVLNPQYYHCKPLKVHPKTEPIRINSTAPVSIGNDGTSFSLNEPPDIPAPPPPSSASTSVLEMSPPTRLAPVIPPRSGNIPLTTTFT